MSAPIQITITPDVNKIYLVGEDDGRADRALYCLDYLDKTSVPVSITFAPEIRGVTYSYFRGLLGPSVAHFNGEFEAFISHYTIGSRSPLFDKSIAPSINALFPPQPKPSAFRLILNKIKAFVPFAGNT